MNSIQTENAQIYALCDGDLDFSLNALSLQEAKDSTKYLDYNKNGLSMARGYVRSVAMAAIEEIEKGLHWIKSTINNDELKLKLFYDGSNKLCANAARVPNEYGRECHITIGLGFVSRFIGFSNRLIGLRLYPSGTVLEMSLSGREGFPQWEPMIDPIGYLMQEPEIGLNSMRISVDSMLLLFMHEVAHATRGHLWTTLPLGYHLNEFQKSLESDADWCSGYLFIKHEIAKSGVNKFKRKDSRNYLVERLIMASFTLNFALQLVSDHNSMKYHLPYTRTRDTLAGAYTAWIDHKIEDDFSELVDSALQQLWLLERIVPYKLTNWIRYDDPRTLQDQDVNQNRTQDIIRTLRTQLQAYECGPIKGVRTHEI